MDEARQRATHHGADLIMIGFWRNGEHPELPAPATLVDPTWDSWERHLTAEYLDGGALAVQWRGFSWCRMCDLTTNGSADLTDSVNVRLGGSWALRPKARSTSAGAVDRAFPD
jgi:hypothetical protein